MPRYGLAIIAFVVGIILREMIQQQYSFASVDAAGDLRVCRARSFSTVLDKAIADRCGLAHARVFAQRVVGIFTSPSTGSGPFDELTMTRMQYAAQKRRRPLACCERSSFGCGGEI